MRQLHGALAKGLLAEKQAPPVVLNSASHDLGGAGGSTVHQHHQRHVADRRLSLGRIVLFFSIPSAFDEDIAFHKEAGNFNRRVQQTSRIAPQVEDQPLGLQDQQGLQRRLHLARCFGGELHQAQVGDVALQHPALDHRNPDALSYNLHLKGLWLAWTQDQQMGSGALGPTDQRDGLAQCPLRHLLVVYGQNHIAPAQASLPGGLTLKRLDDEHAAVRPFVHQSADTFETAADTCAPLCRLLGIEEGGMAVVEQAQHAANGAIGHLLFIRQLTVVVALQGTPCFPEDVEGRRVCG